MNQIIDMALYRDKIKKILCNITPVSKDKIIFLTSRPWFNNNYSTFQSFINSIFPGTHIVSLPPHYINELSVIQKLTTLSFSDDNTISHTMEPSKCHENCIILYTNNLSYRIFSGFALSVDGLWRFHSWIMTDKNVIIETTNSRLIYLGYDATHEIKLCNM